MSGIRAIFFVMYLKRKVLSINSQFIMLLEGAELIPPMADHVAST